MGEGKGGEMCCGSFSKAYYLAKAPNVNWGVDCVPKALPDSARSTALGTPVRVLEPVVFAMGIPGCGPDRGRERCSKD